MAYHNIYQQPGSLEKVAPKIGGLCTILLARWNDVETWPIVNPQTGILSTALQLKPGKTFYTIAATENDRTFKEEQKTDSAGPYLDMQVTTKLAGNSAANTLSLDAMKFFQWVLILSDRNGDKRMIGDEDSGARLTYDYTTGDFDSSRMRNLKFTWQSPNAAPIYSAAAFVIAIGGTTVTVGSLTMIMRFRVGDPGAPMAEGDTTLTNASLANKNLLVLASGIGLPIDDGSGDIDWTGSIERHLEKTLASNTITFVGGVTDKEIIEIYAWN